MNFIKDKQTTDDLNLLGKFSKKSVLSLFNNVRTNGAEKLLLKMFDTPLCDPDEINRRSSAFQYFQGKNYTLDIGSLHINEAENFMASAISKGWLNAALRGLRRKFLQLSGVREEYDQTAAGIAAMLDIISQCRKVFQAIAREEKMHPFFNRIQPALSLPIPEIHAGGELTLLNMIKYDHILRGSCYEETMSFLALVYEFDLYGSVSETASLNNFSYPVALPGTENILTIKNCRYPGLKNAVGNDIHLHQENNVLFLTGANMAGKSTLMKSVGIAVYLAHMGFPVAADSMSFSVKEGIYSSINVADDLVSGHSHYYAEVMRVKKVAIDVSKPKDLFVIFDELFKGTNVKDAYDATLAVTEAFAANRNCFFIISTHIIEVGDALSSRLSNIRFAYLPTIMDGKLPRYTYKLQEGITSDKHGMLIIENEGILDILNQSN